VIRLFAQHQSLIEEPQMSSIYRRRGLRGGLAALFAFAALAAVPALAGAATFTVNTTADNPPAPGECLGAGGGCSLRQAVDSANLAGGTNTIIVPAGTYDLTIEAAAGDGIENGDLNVSDEALTITGAGARRTVIDANLIEDRLFNAEPGSMLNLEGLGITGGRTSGNGGGILAESASLTLDGVALTDNEAYESGSGGGVYIGGGPLLHVVASLIAENRNSGDGGGLFSFADEVSIEDSTLADNVVNTALYPGNPGWAAYGGAMEAQGGKLVIKNATISGNQIIDGNGGEGGAGAALSARFIESEVVNAIIADNTGVEVEEVGQCAETLGSLGHNLETQEPEGEARCFEEPTDLIADPMLAASANNGGETDTVALTASSPAIDAGDSTLCLPTDQRGYARPVGSGCDIGAYEFGAGPPVTPVVPVTPVAKSTPMAVVGGWFGVKKAKRFPRSGDSKLGIRFSSAGTVTITGKGVKTVTKQVSVGLRHVLLVPKGNLKAQLSKSGKATVKVTIAFEAVGGNTFTKRHTVAFRFKR
jgi:CSLREA domain-containing protein